MEKNFKDISCLFCGEKNTASEKQCIKCNNNLNAQKYITGKKINSFTIEEYIGRGFYGLTFKAKEFYGKKYFAIKLISKAAYDKSNKNFKEEAELYGLLPDITTIANYVTSGETELEVLNKKVSFYYIISEWISGKTLNHHIENNDLEFEDIITAATDLLYGLQILEKHKLWHNDLHGENILVEQVDNITKEYSNRLSNKIFKIIDIGSMVYRNPSNVKKYNDICMIGKHLSEMIKVVINKNNISRSDDKLFLLYLEEICTQMIDENPSRRILSAKEALSNIEEAFKSSRAHKEKGINKLDNPFGYINSNDIPSAWLLKNMFSQKLTYFQDILSKSKKCLLITGPRGCGKTMILKNMRFLTIYDSLETINIEKVKQIEYIGLFISARKEFGNHLVYFRDLSWVRNDKHVMLYFNLLITIELLSAVFRLIKDNIIDKVHFKNLTTFICDNLKIKFTSILTLQSKVRKIAKIVISDQNIEHYLTNENSTPNYLNGLFKEFNKSTSSFFLKEIILLVDDLSLPRIPDFIQKSLNPALFNTGSFYKTRITAHSDGSILVDYGNDVYKSNRDFEEINLGYEYWQLSNNYKLCLDSFDDILSKRFELSQKNKYSKLESFLGKNHYDNFALLIKDKYDNKKLRGLKYHGSDIFIKLCTGDISYLIDLLGKMSRLNNAKTPIPIKTQNSVIKNYARHELRLLQDIPSESNINLYEIALSFGIWSKTKACIKGEDYLRFEISFNKNDEEIKKFLRELQCYGIFIDGGYSSSSEGIVSKKLIFRRIYTPAFPTTFNDHNTFPIRIDKFKKFISDPRNFVREKMSADKINPDEQQNLEQLEMDLY